MTKQSAATLWLHRIVRHAKRLTKSVSVRLRKIDENAKCPGCGHRRGRIKFISENKAIGHICYVCDAIWGEPTVIDPQKWL